MNRLFRQALMLLAFITTLVAPACSQTPSRADSERTAGDAIHDASITMSIKTTYLFSRHLNPFRINVDTRDGVVTLHGTVPSDVHRQLAVEYARNADGVTEVRDELRVVKAADESQGEAAEEKSFKESVHDASLTASVKLALAFERGVKATRISVHTDRGTVTLAGQIDSEAERQLAERVARDTEGVKDVVNHLQVRG